MNLALDWIVGRSVSVMQFSGWEAIIRCADHTEWGLNGLGGLYAFELSLDGLPEEPPEAMPSPLPQLKLLPKDQLELELARKAPVEPPQLRQLQVIPLGFGPLLKGTLLAMGLPSLALPFDWLQSLRGASGNS